MRRHMLLVAAGGVLGALTRYYGSLLLAAIFGTTFPAATFAINITGCFGLGLLLTLLMERPRLSPAFRLFGGTGFFGAYTTFSSYSNEALALARKSDYLGFSLYWLGSLFCGMVAVWLGVTLSRRLWHRHERLVQEPDAT